MHKTILGVVGAFLLIMLIASVGKLFENVNAGEIVVIQAPASGKLSVYTTAGLKWQGWGTVTHYKKSFQYWFTKSKDEGENRDQSILVRFNDGGHANISGSIRVTLPLDYASIIKLHTIFGSQEAIEQQLVSQIMNKSVYMTGPMMSSTESYKEKRNYLLAYIEDQAINGVYRTEVVNIKQKDAIDTSVEKTVSVVQILKDSQGQPIRQDVSPVAKYNIKLDALAIDHLDYDKNVEAQIATQQQATAQVQTAIANAKRAEQDKYTVEQQGEADAAKAKWAQEVIKAQAVTEAQQQLEVQTLTTKKAELYKQQQILEGEGDAAKKKLVMAANGALEQKLDAYIQVQKFWADAFSNYKGNIVPQIQTGTGNGKQNGAVDFMEMMGMNAANQLNLNLSNKEK